MKLITKEIGDKLAKAYAKSAECGGGDAEHTPVVAKFFTPWAGATWWITEGGPLDAEGNLTTPDKAIDWHLFGFCDLGDRQCAELGFVLLSDLEGLRGPAGLRVERDLYSTLPTLAQVMGEYA